MKIKYSCDLKRTYIEDKIYHYIYLFIFLAKILRRFVFFVITESLILKFQCHFKVAILSDLTLIIR